MDLPQLVSENIAKNNFSFSFGSTSLPIEPVFVEIQVVSPHNRFYGWGKNSDGSIGPQLEQG